MKYSIHALLLSILFSFAPIRLQASFVGSAVRTDSLVQTATKQQSLPQRLRALLQDEIFRRTQVGIYVYDLTADSLVFAHNEQQCMRPASNEKVVTAIAGLYHLGVDYKLRTRLYATPVAAGDSLGSAALYIKAGYDPLFDGDDLRAFVKAIKAKGIRRLSRPVGLDLTMKDDDRLGWGWCWDDDEVPLKPLLFKNKDRFVDRLREALHGAGIQWDGTVEEVKQIPSAAKLIAERTHTIDQLLHPMMKKSDNSMAEALFYQLAAKSGHRHAGRKQAAAYVDQLIQKVGLNPEHYEIADGSGLSLYNYLSPELLGRLLRFAYREKKIYNHLLPSLPIAAEDGTLRKRMGGTAAAGNVKAKTGTVTGVSTLSGYLTTADGRRLCFSIMNQGIRSASVGRRFQDRVCKALCE